MSKIHTKTFLFAFLFNAAIVAAITALTVETRFAIHRIPTNGVRENNILKKIHYELLMIPYRFAQILGLQSKSGLIPQWIKLLYLFIVSFIVALFVYYIFLGLFGYKKLWTYFFGNFKH